MDFFSDHWLLWTCGFVPSMLYLGIGWIRLRTWERASLFDLFDPRSGHGRGPKPTMRAGEIATVLAWASGAMLVLAAIHVVVYAIFP